MKRITIIDQREGICIVITNWFLPIQFRLRSKILARRNYFQIMIQ